MRRFIVCALTLMAVASYRADLSGAVRPAAVQERLIEGSWNGRSLYQGDLNRWIQISVWDERWMPLSPRVLEEMRDQAEANSGEVRFELVRDAGTIVLEGRLRGSRGSGDFTFTPDLRYADFIADSDLRRLSDRDWLNVSSSSAM